MLVLDRLKETLDAGRGKREEKLVINHIDECDSIFESGMSRFLNTFCNDNVRFQITKNNNNITGCIASLID